MEQAWSDRTRRANPAIPTAESTPDSSMESVPDDPRLPYRAERSPQMTLALVFQDGAGRTYPFYSFEGMDAVSKGVIRVYFTRATVEMEGCELQGLADHLRRHCVSIIRESAPEDKFTLPLGFPFLRKIRIHPPNMEALARKPVG